MSLREESKRNATGRVEVVAVRAQKTDWEQGVIKMRLHLPVALAMCGSCGFTNAIVCRMRVLARSVSHDVQTFLVYFALAWRRIRFLEPMQ